MTNCAIVLASGGLDSTTCLALAKAEGYRVVALSFNYGQRHAVELEAARRVVEHFGVEEHLIVEMPFFRQIGGSALTSDIAVPKHESVEDVTAEIPVTYVPARNLVFLSQAAAVAELHCAEAIFIGVNAVDYSGYPDCRSEFIEAFAQAAQLATKSGAADGLQLRIETPLVSLTKAEIIQLGVKHGAPYELTHSCYSPTDGVACGHCDSCLLRLKGFRDAGLDDPIPYQTAVSHP